MKFDNCGRPIADHGDKWIPLPRILPFQATYTGSPVIGTQKRITNASAFPLMLVGMAIKPGTTVSFRVKWPNGHYLSQSSMTPVLTGGPVVGPVGQAGNMAAFPDQVEIPPGGRIAIENSGVAGQLNLSFWGFLKAPLSLLPPDAGRSLVAVNEAAARLGGSAGVSCLVGYPTDGKCPIGYPSSGPSSLRSNVTSAAAGLVPSQVDRSGLDLGESLRFQCNRNIMLPEWGQGNQCGTFVPPGMDADQFQLFSNPVTLAAGEQSTNVSMAVPGTQGAKTVIRAMRVLATWSDLVAVPTVALRLPNGYSITGGDQIPLTPFQWIPWFPRVGVNAGTRIILDWGNQQAAGAGSITFQLEFDCVKLRSRV